MQLLCKVKGRHLLRVTLNSLLLFSLTLTGTQPHTTPHLSVFLTQPYNQHPTPHRLIYTTLQQPKLTLSHPHLFILFPSSAVIRLMRLDPVRSSLFPFGCRL